MELESNQETVIDTSNLKKYEDQLKSFKPPKAGKTKIPYILYGAWKVDHRKGPDGNYVQSLEHSLVCMEYRDSAPSVHDVMYLLGKAYIILDFYFPSKSDLPERDQQTESGFKALLRSAESDLYYEARSLCQSHRNKAMQINESQKEINALRQELEDVRTKANKHNTSESVASLGKPVAEKPSGAQSK